MFAWWGRAVVRWRWAVLAAGLALAAAGVTWGTGVFGALTSGGFDDPGSESLRAHDRIEAELGNQDINLLVLYTNPRATVEQPALREPVVAAVDKIRHRPEVATALSWYETGNPGLVSTDRHATYVAIQLKATDPDQMVDAYQRLRPALDAPGVRTQVGGPVAFLQQTNERTTADIARAEMLSMPVLLLLLTLIFGGVVAAGTPLLIGGLAILGAFVATRVLTSVTDVSVFAINIITLIGLGMAIDYSLFMVSRFREELARGRGTPEAIMRTMTTAGRTVAVAGLTITLALASLLIFPQVFLRSMGLGGMAAVVVAMLGALTVLPAMLAVLGERINALSWRYPAWLVRSLRWTRRRAARTGPYRAAPEGFWARLARSVMRRPVGYLVGVLAVLAVLTAPVVRMHFGGFDERVLPAGTESRVVTERIAAEFPGGSVAPIDVLVSGAPAAQAQQFAARVAQLSGVTGAAVTANRGESSLISVTYTGEPTGNVAYDTVREIRDLSPPAGAEVLVSGRSASTIDLLDSLAHRLPWMAVMMAAATLVLMFLAFGSVVLPVKAVLMNMVSIGASFGVVVWAFQEGHLAGALGFTSTGFIEPTNPILVLALLFGLATDYEVFLLSRVREEWDRAGDNTTSVATGLQRTGRIITSAALLLIVVVAGFATGGMAFIKLIGIGMIVAILVDATLVRALLVPATMRLLGRWNWWAPGPLARIYRRYGLSEGTGVEPSVEPALAGRTAR